MMSLVDGEERTKGKRSEAHVYSLLFAALEGICRFSTQEEEDSIQDQ
jgi:hypothetical protein